MWPSIWSILKTTFRAVELEKMMLSVKYEITVFFMNKRTEAAICLNYWIEMGETGGAAEDWRILSQIRDQDQVQSIVGNWISILEITDNTILEKINESTRKNIAIIQRRC
jgi:hypothetical protein